MIYRLLVKPVPDDLDSPNAGHHHPIKANYHTARSHSPRCVRLIGGAEMSSFVTDLRILIVDDSDAARRILGTIVRSRHWTVCGEAETGWAGVKKFQELRPDVVLLDLAMPDINGIEAARWMSSLDPTVPIILFTVLDLD